MVGTSSTTMRRALAVGAAVLLLWGAVVVGAFGGGLVVGVVRPTSATTGAVVLVLATAACWSLAVRWAARAVVPRLAGRAYLPATPEIATRLTTIAVGVAAAGVGMLEVGGRVALAIAWVVGLGVLGVVVVRWRPAWRRGARTVRRAREARPSLHGQEGAMAAEHVAVIIVIGAVTAALVAAPIAPTVGVWARYAVCSLFGGDCEHPEALQASGEPSFACEQTSSTRGGNLNASLVVDLDRQLEYALSTFSDGTAQLLYSNDAAVGIGAGGGVQLDLYWGEGGLTLGGQASASGALRFVEGEVYVFEGADAAHWARQYRSIHAASEASSDLLLGGRDGLLGWAASNGVRGVNALLNELPIVNGIEYRSPDRTLLHVAGGIELEASATGGLPGLSGSTSQVGVEAALARAVGRTIDLASGETTVYVSADTGITTEGHVGGAGGSDLAWSASWSNESLVAITIDGQGRPTSAQVTTYRLDEGGRDLAGVTDLRSAFPDRRFGTGTASGGQDALGDPSLYQVETRLDLTDPDNATLLADVLAGQALTGTPDLATDYGAELALRRVHESGETVIVEHRDAERRYGGELVATPLFEVGGGGSLQASDRAVLDAWYYDEWLGRYAPWVSCTGRG
jgi:hypothetical protein